MEALGMDPCMDGLTVEFKEMWYNRISMVRETV